MGMKFMLRGGETVYDCEAGIEKASLGLLYELKVKTGVGVKQLARMVQTLGKFEDPMDALSDKDAFRALMIVIWLARRHAGEKLSVEEANDVALNDFILVRDEPEEVEEAAPKATLPDSGPGASGQPPAGSQAT